MLRKRLGAGCHDRAQPAVRHTATPSYAAALDVSHRRRYTQPGADIYRHTDRHRYTARHIQTGTKTQKVGQTGRQTDRKEDRTDKYTKIREQTHSYGAGMERSDTDTYIDRHIHRQTHSQAGGMETRHR